MRYPLLLVPLLFALPAQAQKAKVWDGALLKCESADGSFMRMSDKPGEYVVSQQIAFAPDLASLNYAAGVPQFLNFSPPNRVYIMIDLSGNVSPAGKVLKPLRPQVLKVSMGMMRSGFARPAAEAQIHISSAAGKVPSMRLPAPMVKMGMTLANFSISPNAHPADKVSEAAFADYIRTVDAKPATLTLLFGGKEYARVGFTAPPSVATVAASTTSWAQRTAPRLAQGMCS